MSDQPVPSEQLQQLVEQLAQQQQLIEELYRARTDTIPAVTQAPSVPHDLPVHPTYDWVPSQVLASMMPTLEQPIFSSMLAAMERKQLIVCYPAMQGLKYAPPAPVPQAAQRFNRGPVAEDTILHNLQYTLSAILRPLDVLGHMLHLILPPEQLERIFLVLNNVRTLVLHTGGYEQPSQPVGFAHGQSDISSAYGRP